MKTRGRIHEDHDRDRNGRPRPGGGRPARPEPTIDSQVRQGGVIRDLKDGFGFIQANDGCDRFFHKAEMKPESKPFHELVKGDHCTFLPATGAKGPRAVEVVIDAD